MLTKSDKEYIDNLFVERVEKQGFLKKSEFLVYYDTLMGELKAIREEIAVFVFRQSEHSDQLENHEVRLDQLEKRKVVN